MSADSIDSGHTLSDNSSELSTSSDSTFDDDDIDIDEEEHSIEVHHEFIRRNFSEIFLQPTCPWMSFFESCAEGNQEAVAKILDSHCGENLNKTDVDGFTGLMIAAAEGHEEVVIELLRRDAEVDVKTFELKSVALHFAAKNGNPRIVEAICKKNPANVSATNVNGDIPLIWACIEGRDLAVKVLLDHNSDVNAANNYGATTLMCAMMIGERSFDNTDKNRANIVRMLLKKNPKLVNLQDRDGSTAMHLAAACGYLKCVKALLEFNADITLRNAIGETAIEEARTTGHSGSQACVDFLKIRWKMLEEEAAMRMMSMWEKEDADEKKRLEAAKKTNKKAKKKTKKVKQNEKKNEMKEKEETVEDDNSSNVIEESEKEEEEENHYFSSSLNLKLEQEAPSNDYEKENEKVIFSNVSSPNVCETFEKSTRIHTSIIEPMEYNEEGDWTTVERKKTTSVINSSIPSSVETNIKSIKASNCKRKNKKTKSSNNRIISSELDMPSTSIKQRNELVDRKLSNVENISTDHVEKAFRSDINTLQAEDVDDDGKTESQEVVVVALENNSCDFFTKDTKHIEKEMESNELRQETKETLNKMTNHMIQSTLSSMETEHELKEQQQHQQLFDPIIRPLSASNVNMGMNINNNNIMGQLFYPSSLSINLSNPSFDLPNNNTNSNIWLNTNHLQSNPSNDVELKSNRKASLEGYDATLSDPTKVLTTSTNRIYLPNTAFEKHYSRRSHITQYVGHSQYRNTNLSSKYWTLERINQGNQRDTLKVFSYLICGICRHIVQDNLECPNTSCCQLYCRQCLEDRVLSSPTTHCTSCSQQFIILECTKNQLAEKQVKCLNVNSEQDETVDGLKMKLYHACPLAEWVGLDPVHLIPGVGSLELSIGQMDVLEEIHYQGIREISDARMECMRLQEIMHIQEKLKTQRDIYSSTGMDPSTSSNNYYG